MATPQTSKKNASFRGVKWIYQGTPSGKALSGEYLASGLNIPGKILSKTRTMKPERKNSSPKEGTGA
jgi:hypothetical protein